MEKYIIQVPKGIRYISEYEEQYGFHLQDFPHILDKSIPGCGFTTWALTNSQNVILASPRKVLMKNKKKQLDKMKKVSFLCLPVEEEKQGDSIIDKDLNKISKDHSSSPSLSIDWDKLRIELSEFINQCLMQSIPIKIIVTYDSYRKVKEIIELISPKLFESFYTVVDEFQSIFTDSRFKPTTEMEFVDVLAGVQKVCYVSATPMIAEYLEMMDQFKNLPYYEFDWKTLDPGRVKEPKLHSRALRSINTALKPFISDYRSGKFEHKLIYDSNLGRMVDRVSKELVIYINSVKDIISVIRFNKLMPEEVNIICSDTEKNRKEIKTKLTNFFKVEYEIGVPPLEGEPRKMFTFCTRTVYLGADFYSDNARSIIISDANVETLAVDITLDLPQIMGRQRCDENPWKSEAYFITKSNLKPKAISQEEFDKIIQKKIDSTNTLIGIFQRGTIEEKLEIIRLCENQIRSINYKEDYISINYHSGKTPQLELNTLVAIAEKRAFQIQEIELAKRCTTFNELYRNGFIVDEGQSIEVQKLINDIENTRSTAERMKLICESGLPNEKLEEVFSHLENGNYRNFYLGLGPEKCKALGYNFTFMKKEYSLKFFNTDRVREEILSQFKIGDRMTSVDIKSQLGIIYRGLSYEKTPKATDLEEYFETRSIKLKDGTGKWVNGFELLKLKN